MADPKSSKKPYPESEYGKTGRIYEYSLKLEILVGEDGNSVSIASIFSDFVKRLSENVDGEFIIYDTNKQPVEPFNLPQGSEFKDRFRVEIIEGKTRKLFLGFYLKSETPMSTFKHRMLSYLKAKRIFVRTHFGPYTNSMQSILVGYFHETNPDFASLKELTERLNGYAKATLCHSRFTPAATHELVRSFYGNLQNEDETLHLPFNLGKVGVTVKHPEKNTYEVASAIGIFTTKDHLRPIKAIIDAILMNKVIRSKIIPMGLKQENPTAFHKILIRHKRFLATHRNIQIRGIRDDENRYELQQKLSEHPHVAQTYFDEWNLKLNVSTNADKFMSVCEWIDKLLGKISLDWDYTPYRHGTSNSSTTNYTGLLSDLSTNQGSTDSDEDSNPYPTPPNAWIRRPPIRIEYNIADTHQFPNLQKKTQDIPNNESESTTPSTAPSTLCPLTADNSESLQQLIDNAIKKAMDQIKADYESQLASLKSSIDAQMTTLDTKLESTMAMTIDTTISKLLSSKAVINSTQYANDQVELHAKLDRLLSRDDSPTRTAKRKDTKSTPTHTPSRFPVPPNNRHAMIPIRLENQLHNATSPSHPTMSDDDMEGSE